MCDAASSKTASDPLTGQDLTPRSMLLELFKLLEDYAPAWYTQAVHDRIVAALKERDQGSPEIG